MRWIRAWFWSQVRDSENWAQTLVRVSGNLLRIALTIAVLGTAGLASTTYLADRTDRQRRAQVLEESRSIDVVASYFTPGNDNGCNERFPLALSVTNDSSKALMRMTIAVSARIPGTSTNVLTYGQREIGWDHIVPSGYSMTMCYMPPSSAPEPAVFAADPIHHTVVLQESEQWMIDETSATSTP